MPLYETKEDIGREREVASRLSEKYHVDFVKMPKTWPVDWACVDKSDNVLAFVEIKCRHNYTYEWMDRNGGLILDVRKLVAFDNLIRTSGLSCTLAIQFKGGDIYTWTHREGLARPFRIVVAGRRDRDDGMEACAIIPMSFFKLIHRSRNEASP